MSSHYSYCTLLLYCVYSEGQLNIAVHYNFYAVLLNTYN